MSDLARQLLKQSGTLFEQRFGLMSLWQTMAENFYPERADFTRQRNLGEEFASNLLSSYPLMARRDLQGIISSMLRRGKWFDIGLQGGVEAKVMGKRWLERTRDVQFKLMYERQAGFTKSTKMADGDFVTFGNAVISVELRRDRDGLIYRTWHPRDVVWSEDEYGMVDCVFRRWKPQAKDVLRMFPETVHENMKRLADKAPFAEVNLMHVVCPAEMVGGDRKKDIGDAPYVSVYIDQDNQHELEMVGIHNKMYVIPRWQLVSGSQYAYSPSSVAALPDARLIQAMTMTLLEAGEKFTNPPLLAVEEAIRSDIQVYAGGITWVDSEYDERMGDVLRPMSQDKSGMPLGFEMAADIREQISMAFYLNQLQLPDVRQMTAYEVQERMQQFINQTLPLFEPMEQEYNGQLCDITFDILMRNGFFGSPIDIPKELQGADIEFQFESPISQAEDKQKGQLFAQTAEMLAVAAQADPGSRFDVDVSAAFRDALDGIGVPNGWITDEEQAEEAKQNAMAAQAATQLAEAEAQLGG